MAVPFLQKAQGNGASTTASAGISNTDTSVGLTSDTAFGGEGMLIMDEGQATEEVAYGTGKVGSTVSIPLANRGLEGGSAQAHTGQFTVKGILSAGMWNNVIDALTNLVSASTGAVDTTKVVTPSGTQTLTNKTLTAPQIGGDADLDDATGNITVQGSDPYRTIVIPAGSMSPTTTAGCASVATVEAGTNDVDYRVLDFDTTTAESAWVLFQMPNNWDGGTITFKPVWTAASGSGTVCFGLKGRAYADDDAIDQAYGTEQTSTDTLITAGDVHIGPESSVITLAGSPAGGQLVQLKITRQTGSDTLGVDARLIGIRILYKISQYSD